MRRSWIRLWGAVRLIRSTDHMFAKQHPCPWVRSVDTTIEAARRSWFLLTYLPLGTQILHVPSLSMGTAFVPRGRLTLVQLAWTASRPIRRRPNSDRPNISPDSDP